MLHIENEKIRNLLLRGYFGLEKESLRILQDGSMSHLSHPFNDEHIVRDFCENQIEINTSVYDSAQKAHQVLFEHTKEVQSKLASLDEPELLWIFSNPPYIKREIDIPIAKFYGNETNKTAYRHYLSNRYGRYKMSLSGIHVNYSFANELLELDFQLSEETDYRTYKDKLYLFLAQGAVAYGWIITALTAASPLLDSSYFEKGEKSETVFVGMSSVRCSELGYWNYFAPMFDYSNMSKYVESIQYYVDKGLISVPSELYYPIRLKPPGKNSLEKLEKEGVNHIELRMVDLNPYELAGLDVRDLKFIQLLLVWIVGSKQQSFYLQDQAQAIQNFKNAAHYDLKTVNILLPDGEVCSVVDAGIKVIGFMKDFYKDFSKDILDILDYEEAKFLQPELRYAWRFRKEFEENYMTLGLSYAKLMQEEILNV